MNTSVQPSSSCPLSQQEPSLDSNRTMWLTAAEAAAFLGFKPRTILLWARQGRIKAYALTGTRRRVWRFSRSDLQAMVMHKKPVVSSPQPSVLAHERSENETSTA